MPRERDRHIGDTPRARPLETFSETGGGIPDEAVGPEQRTIPEQLDLADSDDAEAMAAKLQAEADERWRTGKTSRAKPRRPGPADQRR